MGIAVRRVQSSHLWAIQASYFSRALVDAAKAIPGMNWNSAMRSWVGYVDAVEATANLLRERGIRIERSLLDRHLDVVFRYRHHVLFAMNGADGRILRDYQKAGVDFLICTAPTGAILADEMGIGKSAEAIVAVRAFGGKTLIVCPSSARGVWADPQRGEIAKWWPKGLKEGLYQPRGTSPGQHAWKAVKYGFRCALCTRKHLARNQAEAVAKPAPATEDNYCEANVIPSDVQLVVIHIDILHAWVEAIIAWGPVNVVIDEAHLLQSEKSRRSKAAKEIVHAESVQTRIALTGTPLTNRVRDLWNLVDTVSLGRFGKNFFRFGVRYCDGQQVEVSKEIGAVWQFEGKTELEELQKRLALFTLRRTKEEVKLELPPKTRQILRLEVPASYRQADIGKIDKKLIQAVLVRAVDGKLPQVVTLVREHLEAGQSVVVFAFRRLVAEHFVTQLSATGFPCRFIHGDVPQVRRDGILNELRDASLTGPVMLAATIDCTAVAIDLTFASVAVVAELTYEPHELLQAEARPHRFGQSQAVLVQYPIAMGTIEEAIAEVVIDRLDTFETLIGKTDGLARALAGDQEADLLAQLGDRLLAMTADLPATTKRKKIKP
jgi:SNF2 family DNA or RNA helicase